VHPGGREVARATWHELENLRLASHAPAGIPPSEEELLRELWLISHFGWIGGATISRALIISGAREVRSSGLGDRLEQLVNRGWVERRQSDGGTEEPEWRLTDSGRDVLAHRA
jgi:DNA-binding MarR family transcriptional regulator